MTREIAALAIATGIAPNELMDTDFEMLNAMADVVNERSKSG